MLAKLEAKGLSYSPEAPKLTLLRRAYMDATGLPPTPQEIEAYQNDTRPDAYERLVDQLLASPRYGERWAKFWLDAAGYSDSEGIIDEDLVRPDAWRYRDYVIRSLNADKPYDRFLTEQIAGDELVNYKNAKTITPEMIEKVTATGFLRMVPDGTYSPANGSVAERMNVIADEIEVLSSSVMGLTIGCARCHNHKYDPLPQRDYYRLSAILQILLRSLRLGEAHRAPPRPGARKREEGGRRLQRAHRGRNQAPGAGGGGESQAPAREVARRTVDDATGSHPRRSARRGGCSRGEAQPRPKNTLPRNSKTSCRSPKRIFPRSIRNLKPTPPTCTNPLRKPKRS